MNLRIAGVFTLSVVPLKMVRGIKKIPISIITAYVSSLLFAPELISNEFNFSKK